MMTISKEKWLKWFVLALGCAAILFALTQIGYAGTERDSYQERVKESKLYYNVHPSFADEQKMYPEVAEKLLSSWNGVADKLSDIIPVKDWKLVSSGDLDLEVTNGLPDQEVSTFNEALFSDQRKSELQKGDLYPGALISPSEDRVILFWEKFDGSAVYLHIDSKTDSDGTRTWFLNGEVNRIAK
ncbi:hypothetical protein [Cohnella sp.]|uniref:hypothetical protein n=1 Tax=Cohnella sp. TaxID=1883426 RepID=UPI0035685010